MLTTSDLRTALSRISYRPGWELSIWEDQHEGPVLRIVADVPDSYHPSQRVDLGIDTYLSPNDRDTIVAFVRFVDWRLQRIANHEHREWFKLNGRVISDPHAPDANE